jgi:hypothetical protein
MRLFLFFALAFAMASPSYADSQFLKVGNLCSAATGTGACTTIGPVKSGRKVYQASVTGTGAVTATVLVQGSTNASVNGWITIGTITLSGTTTATDAFSTNTAWPFVRGNITAVTGTGATIYLTESAE